MQPPAETRGSVLFTARTALRCLRDPQITAWTTQRPGLNRFDPAAFLGSRQTLYLLSKDGGGPAAPLVAALTDRVLRWAVNAAQDRGGRLDPPLLAVLDEAANVYRIADLPQLYSHLGSRGILPLTIPAVLRPGRSGVGPAWDADPVECRHRQAARRRPRRSRLRRGRLPPRRRPRRPADSWSHGHGRTTRTSSTRRERILPAAELRALPKGSALLLATGTRPALPPLFALVRRVQSRRGRQRSPDRDGRHQPARHHGRSPMTDDAVTAHRAAARRAAGHRPVPVGATPAEFVEHVIAPLYAQHLTGNGTWCASWWDHDDALVRLEAVWCAWEALRLEPTTGIARWLRDVADPQVDRDRDRGPFRACGEAST